MPTELAYKSHTISLTSTLQSQYYSMGDCSHPAWIEAAGHHYNCAVFDTRRIRRLADTLPSAQTQVPSFVTFFGHRLKADAMRQLFPYNNFKKGRQSGLVQLNIDNATAFSDQPLFIADAGLNFELQPRLVAQSCHEQISLPLQWTASDTQAIFDHVFARAVVSISHILVMFANDFQSLQILVEFLSRWISIGVPSDAPAPTRPRLIIVVNGTYDRQEIMGFYSDLEAQTGHQVTSMFSLVSTVYLETDGLSELATYRPLKEEIRRQLDEFRVDLRKACWLFSTPHLIARAEYSLRHVSATIAQPLQLLSVMQTALPSDASTHVARLTDHARNLTISYYHIASYIASAIMVHAYPREGHCRLSVHQSPSTTDCSSFRTGPDLR
jgi:hypothetical protein